MRFQELTIARTLEEVEKATDLWLGGDPPFNTTGAASAFGSECAWTLMRYCQKYVLPGEQVDPLDDADAREKLMERLEFLIEKAGDGRWLLTPKAFDQVNSLLWLLGQDSLDRYESFEGLLNDAVHLEQVLTAPERVNEKIVPLSETGLKSYLGDAFVEGIRAGANVLATAISNGQVLTTGELEKLLRPQAEETVERLAKQADTDYPF